SGGAASYHELDAEALRERARLPQRYLLEGIAFGPWTEGGDPTAGATITPQAIWDRLRILRGDSAMVRTYSVSSGLEDAGWILHQLGKEAVIGAWLDDDEEANRTELETLIRLAHEGEVDVAVVGSEVLLRGDLEPEALLALLREARERLPAQVPLTTADTRESFLAHPELLDAIDLVYVNYHPYWAGVAIEDAVPTLAAWHDEMLEYAGATPVVVSEAGWPSAGGANGDAEATPANAARFFLEFVSWARRGNVRYTYFSAFDEPWKANDEGPEGAHWGYREAGGALKPGMQAVFDGLSTPAGEPSLELVQVPPRGSEDDLFGVATGVATLRHRVAVLHEVDGAWYSKPSFAERTVRIGSDGRFSVDVTTGPGDADGTRLAVFLVGEEFTPPRVEAAETIPLAFTRRARASAFVERRAPATPKKAKETASEEVR
ncbi:MAG: glycosyl hydrolase family 17 protein, partial [Planctomycetota bacterium]